MVAYVPLVYIIAYLSSSLSRGKLHLVPFYPLILAVPNVDSNMADTPKAQHIHQLRDGLIEAYRTDHNFRGRNPKPLVGGYSLA